MGINNVPEDASSNQISVNLPPAPNKEIPIPSLQELVVSHPNAFYNPENTLNSQTPYLLLREKSQPNGVKPKGLVNLPDFWNQAPPVVPSILITEKKVIMITYDDRQGNPRPSQHDGIPQIERYNLERPLELANLTEYLPTIEEVQTGSAKWPEDIQRIDNHNTWALVNLRQLKDPNKTTRSVVVVGDRSISDFEELAAQQISESEKPSTLNSVQQELQNQHPNILEPIIEDKMGREYLLTKPILGEHQNNRYLFTPDGQCFWIPADYSTVPAGEIPVQEIMHLSRNINPERQNDEGVYVNLPNGKMFAAFSRDLNNPSDKALVERDIGDKRYDSGNGKV